MSVVLWIGSALAGFGVRTEREPLPAREVERAVVIPKGWTELSLHMDRATATEGFRGSGTTPLPVRWVRAEVMAGLRYGLAPGWEVFATLPWRHSRAFVDQHDFGTAEVGTRLGLAKGEAPSRSLALELGARMPIGFDGGGLTGGELPHTVGTGDLRLGVLARQKWGGLRFDGSVFGSLRFAGRPSWLGARLKPGNRVSGRAAVLVQLGPLAVGPQGEFSWSEAVRTGDDATVLLGTGGLAASTGGRAVVQISRGFEIEGRGMWTLAAPDDRFVFVDELHGAKTRRLGLGLRGRW